MNIRELSLLGIAATSIACTEPGTTERRVAPGPALEARLEISDPLPVAGATIVVRVRLFGENRGRVASFTQRVRYDTTGLRFVDELPLDDGVIRVSNPTAGLIRSAGISAQGFGDSPLVSYRFQVLEPSAVNTLHLTIDEMHDVGRVDAKSKVAVARTPGAPRQ